MVPGIFRSQLEILSTGLPSKRHHWLVNQQTLREPCILGQLPWFQSKAPNLAVDAGCRKHNVITKQASWGALPDAVVSEILWSDDLHIWDRRRCQQVCQNGKAFYANARADLSVLGCALSFAFISLQLQDGSA